MDEIFPGMTHDVNSSRGGRSVLTDEIGFAFPQGTQKQLRLTLAPLSNANEQLIGYVSIFEDISKQKQVEEKLRLEEELRRAREFDLEQAPAGVDDSDFYFEGIIGKNGGIGKIYGLVQKVARNNTIVLITGESGTGKELIARAIHLNGSRKNMPFVGVNCGAIPETLIESELFGHARGAFTGAVAEHLGLFKQADQGTIFLDEVGELPLHLQVKLLRVLQEKAFTPVGGNKQMKVDVRVISATNRDLHKEMEDGRFRRDLFYRLNVVQIVMPPLRNRKEDIPTLAHHFMHKFAASHGKQVEEISSGALMHLMGYGYPGNVRELENCVERFATMAHSNLIREMDIPCQTNHCLSATLWKYQPNGVVIPIAPVADDRLEPATAVSMPEAENATEREQLVQAMERSGWVQAKAARLLNLTPRQMGYALKKYNIPVKKF